MLVVECPSCGRSITERDDLDDVFVEEELCDRCRKREQEFDDGMAEVEAAHYGEAY